MTDSTNEDSSNQPPLHRYDYPIVEGKIRKQKENQVYAWFPVHTSTGEVDVNMCETFIDELSTLCDGWRWERLIIKRQ